MKITRFLPFSILLFALLCRSGAAPRSHEITVATYNVQNLFDDHDDPYREDETTPVKSPESMKAVAEVIDGLNADILGLQEVENRWVLERLNTEFLRRPYPYVVLIEGNDRRGIDVGLLSRLPVLYSTSHRHRRMQIENGNFSIGFARDLLEVRLQATTEDEIILFVSHFRSGVDDPRKAFLRRHEARIAREIIKKRLQDSPDALLFFIGDMNDLPDSGTLGILRDDGETALFDAAPPAGQWTYPHNDSGSRIDYILMSGAMQGRYVKGSARVVDTDPTAKASDHRPVTASFRLSGKPAFRKGAIAGRAATDSQAAAFRLVSPDDPLAQSAIPATNLEDLERLAGKEVTVKGRCYKVALSPSGRLTFIDLARNYREAASVIILNEDREKFTDLVAIVGETLLIRGQLKMHKGRPQIVLEKPSHLSIVKRHENNLP
ncbi:endonuclease/exonuclease/phosphatase family protein [Acidobacteriota bacterium]